MKQILGIVKMHEKTSIKKTGTKSIYYRFTMPSSVLKKLDLSPTEHVAFKKKIGCVQLVKATAAPVTKTQRFMGRQKVGTRGRMCLPKEVVAFFNIADGDYLKVVELGTNDIRLRKLDVGR